MVEEDSGPNLVECARCRAASGRAPYKAKAAKFWNRRPTPPAPSPGLPGAIVLSKETVKSMMDDLHSFLDMQHWEDCAARKDENEGDVDDNPSEYLEDCECSIRPIHEIYAILKATLLDPGEAKADPPAVSPEDIQDIDALFRELIDVDSEKAAWARIKSALAQPVADTTTLAPQLEQPQAAPPEPGPKTLYLNPYDQDEDETYHHEYWEDATWSEDLCENGAVKYIRADLAPPQAPVQSTIIDIVNALRPIWQSALKAVDEDHIKEWYCSKLLNLAAQVEAVALCSLPPDGRTEMPKETNK